MALNGIKIGVKDLYYALLSSDASSGAVYGVPVNIIGVNQININPNSSSDTYFGDDGPLETISQLGKIEVEINTADLSLKEQAALLGNTAPTAGIMIKKSTDTPPWVAVGFKSKKSNGHYRYVWLLKGKFGEPEDNSETQKDSINFQSQVIKGNFVKREYDEGWKKIADEDATGWTAGVGTGWFTDGPDSP